MHLHCEETAPRSVDAWQPHSMKVWKRFAPIQHSMKMWFCSFCLIVSQVSYKGLCEITHCGDPMINLSVPYSQAILG